MKIKYELATAALWLVSILTTLYFVRDAGIFGLLLPVYFMCMVGSIMIVRQARQPQPGRN